jgi:hypothetical protein
MNRHDEKRQEGQAQERELIGNCEDSALHECVV